MDLGLIFEARAAEAHRSPALGPVGSNVYLKTVAFEGSFAVVADGGGQKMILDIGPAYAGLGANEAAALEVVGSAQALFRQQPAGAEARLGQGR